MDLQPAVEEEGLPAEVAHERLPGAVDQHVGLELVVVGEADATVLAGERFLPRVEAEVSFQVVVEVEPRSTDVARERLLSRVDHFVSFEGGAGPVRAAAQVTGERPVARVLPLVHGERVGVLEGLLAHGAFVLPGVGVDLLVEAQGVLALELLPARGAAERPLLRVHGQVAPELDRRLAGLVAELTLEQLVLLLVAQKVVFQRLLDPERFGALVAGERLRWFGHLVTFEVVLERLLLLEGPLTPNTREGQRGFRRLVTQKVIFKRLLLQEASAALLTRKRLLVDLHVFLQITFPVKPGIAELAEEPLPRLRLCSSETSPRRFIQLHLCLL